MYAHKEQTDSYQQKLLSLASKSKQDFRREYTNYDEASARGVYLQILTELAKAMSDGNVDSLKKLSNLIEYIGNIKCQISLTDYYNDAGNPIKSTNLVILACKHNKVEVLKFIFSNSKVLENLSINVGKDAIAPSNKDETCHDAFYYAIRSGNVKLLDTLINKWPDDYFAARSEELDEVLSKDYEELKLKNVLLSDEIEIFVEDKLINLRFFSNPSEQVQSAKNNLDNIRKRVDLVIENIGLLKAEYLNEKEVDEKFLFVATFIAQNIHVLKRQLKSTYDRLPWEEIEFCLVSFVSCHVKRQEINIFYRSTLNKSRVLNHLENFVNKLEVEKEIIEDVSIGKLSDLPKPEREKVIAEIVSNCPQFEELYKDHQQIRDIHSVEKINNYIQLGLSADPKEREGQLIITRVLQIIGEYLKNTLESPKLSNTTSELLLLSLPKNTRKIIVDLRNSLSHAYSLSKRTEIEENKDINFFVGIQNDTKKIGVVITDILYNNKIKMIRMLLEKFLRSNNLDEIKEVATVLSTVEYDQMISENFKLIEHEKLEKLIKELSDNIPDKADHEKEMFNKIHHIMNSANALSKSIRTDFITGLALLKSLIINLNKNKIDHNVIRGMKFRANETLKNMSLEIEHGSLKEIAELSMKIFHTAKSRIQCDNRDKVTRLVYEIFYIAEFATGDIKYIEELKGKLNEKGSFIPSYKQRKAYKLTAKKYNDQLALKLSELKDVLSKKSLIGKSNETLSFCKKDEKLQAVVEMLVLDIMSILGSSNNYLENNLLFLDDNTPLLNGKCLRNHLAHDNALVYILLSDPSITVILNAKKLTEGNIIGNKKRIGKLVNDDLSKLKERYNRGLVNITRQGRMFIALEEGNLESLIDCLKKGADINARSINSWTTLHSAAKGTSLNVIKFLLDQNLSLNVKDANGQSPLHVAAAHGRKNIVEFLIKEAGLYVDDRDKFGKTPLHLASQSGYKDTVEVLLKNKANIAIQDLPGLSPLHYAIRNNHVEVAKFLLAKDANVDINEIMGGFTPLHEAAECGHLELVNFLLQNRANINVRSDKGATPLHLAALNGHLEVVRALILKGADVNARVINGCTPLHYAVENGHQEIASVLLKHGANVNTADKTYNNTPLHYAAQDGYEGIVKILLKNKADTRVQTVTGITPLHFAAQRGHLATVIILLKHGVDIHAKDKNKATPLHHAAESGHKEVAELLIKDGADVNARSNDDLTPLHVAVLKGYRDIADLLIRNKAEVDAQDIEGMTALHTAAINGSTDIIDLLIKNKAEVNARTNGGITPLHTAASQGNLNAIGFLIKNKAKVNAGDMYGLTPLHSAVLKGDKDVVTLLIKNKARVDARGIADTTPLHIAVREGHKDIVKILVANGANVNMKNVNSMPLLCAIQHNHKEIVEVLIANGANVNEENNECLFLAVLTGYRDIVEILLKNGARVNIKGPENATPLHLAATRGHKEIVNALIKRGADVDAMAIGNATPLVAAAQKGHMEVVEILIANRADVNVMCIEGTPLHLAVGSGHDSVVKVLLNSGAKMNVKDMKNRTPLELAVAHDHLQIVKMLLQYKRVDMNSKGNDNWTILHIASQSSNLEMVKYLVAEGSDINAKNASGSKPMHIAAREGHKDIVEFFLNKGLSVDELGSINQTSLHYATFEGQVEVVKYLISAGADVNAQDANGVSPVHFAAKFGHKDVIEVLLKNGAVYNSVDKFYRRPLDMSLDKDVVDLLASTDKLFKAVKHNNPKEVESCIEAGAFVNAKSADGGIPLCYAAWKGYDTIVNLLLQNKADPNVVLKNGITPLHYAAKFSHLKVVRALLSNGAVYNAVSNAGKVPSDFAVDKSITSLFQLISESFKNIKNGNSKVINDLNRIKDVDTIKAIMGARNKENKTLMVIAVHNNFPKLEELKQISQGDVSFQIAKAYVLMNENAQGALSILRSAFEKRKEILGPDNPGTLDIQMHIAKVLYGQGSYQEALNTSEDIFQKQRNMLGLDNKETLSTRNMIALILHRQGKNEEAFNIYQEVYQKQKEILGPNHSDTIDTQFHMALVLDRQGKYEEALNVNRAVFEKRKEILGANAPNTVRAQNNIAMVLANQGKCEEALKIYKEVYEKKKLVFGINHSDTLRTLHNIAGVLLLQKKYHEALQVHQEVLTIQRNVLGPNHPDTLNTQFNIGNVLFAQGKWIGALRAYREGFDQRKAVLGSSHPSVLGILEKVKMINMIFKLEGSDESEILQNLQKEINVAASNGDTQTVQCLLKGGADVNDKDIDGRTPLHYAVSYRWVDVVNVLLKAGADVTQVTNKGNTPLHTAASKGYKEIVEVLLQHASHNKLNDFINAKTTAGGTTSLHVAAKNGFLDVAKSLLKHGAIYNIKNNEGKIPLDLSEVESVAKLLKLVEELFKDAKGGNVEIISKLKAIKSDERIAMINARNNQGKTLLQVATVNKHRNIASRLLEMLREPDQIQSRSSFECGLKQLETLKSAAELHIRFSKMYLRMLRGMSEPYDSERNPSPWKTLKEGSYYLGNAYSLVEKYKKCTPGTIGDKNMEVIDATLVALQFDPKHITSGYTEEAYGGKAECFVSRGEGTVYYKLLHSELKQDIRSFVEMVERDIDAPVKRFLESIKQKLQFVSSEK